MPAKAARPASEDPPQPQVPGALRAITEAVFAGISRLRGARPFHPRGAAFTAVFVPRARQPLAFLDDQPQPALARLSNAAGLPAGRPDVFGLAVRLSDGAGPERPQDLLLASSFEAPAVRHVLAPAWGFDTRRYSSLLLYRHREHRLLVGARYSGPPRSRPLRLADLEQAAGDGGLAFTLAVCTPLGAWSTIGELAVHRRLPAAEGRRLRFHPWNTSPQLRPVGWLNHLRAGAYEAAQRKATSE